MTHPLEDLEALAAGETGGPGLQDHLAACPDCRAELAMLRREGALLARAVDATDGQAAKLWPAVEHRVRQKQRRRWAVRAAAGFAAAAAAAAIVLSVRSREPEDLEPRELPASAAVALERADQEYRAAIVVLEARVQGRRGFARAQAGLSRARAAAREPGARVRLLEGYAAYLKSLRRSLDEGEQ